MGTLVGHVAPSFGFLLIGLWHLFNHIKLHSLHPTTYTSPPWFPSRRFRYAEPVLIIAGSLASIAMELFIGPDHHQPLDDDWSIPSNHLHNFEHSSISFSFLLYAAFAIVLDRTRLPLTQQPPELLRAGLTQLLAAAAFAQQLLMFHLHSADHMGVEGQYHWLLQIVVAVSLATTLIGIPRPKSFLISFVRSVSIAFQGVWFIVMGYVLWTPALVPKGCFMNLEEGHQVVRCRDHGSLERAKSLVNIQFSWLMAVVVILSMVFYLVLTKKYSDQEVEEYVSLDKLDDDSDDLESQEEKKKLEESQSFVHIGRGMEALNLER